MGSPATPAPPRKRLPAINRVSRQELAVYRPVWLATGGMYALFAVLTAAVAGLAPAVAPGLAPAIDPWRVWPLTVWLAVAALIHLRFEPPPIGSAANHAVLACAWCSVAAGFFAAQPSGGLAVGGAMFIAPLISFRLTSRREIAAHVAGASGALLLVAATGVFADLVDLTTVFAAGLIALATPVQAVSCTAVLEAAEAQGLELQRVARRDPLTGIGNRRLFDERLTSEFARHQRLRLQLSVLSIDLDGFSAIEQHDLTGSTDVLRATAAVLAARAPAADCAVRLDGDEFMLLLPESSPLQAANAAAELGAALGEIPRPDTGTPLTACIAVATAPGDASTARDLHAILDQRVRDEKARRHREAEEAEAARDRATRGFGEQPGVREQGGRRPPG